MRTPSAQEMLRIWEEGQASPPWSRAMLLLEAAEPELGSDALAQLPVGERDVRLVDLRERLFGDQLASLAECPACHEKLELTFSVSDVRPPGPDAAEPFRFELGEVAVTFRLPVSADLQDLRIGREAPRRLLEACVIEVVRGGEIVSLDDLDQAEVVGLIEHIADTDPRADLKAEMVCARCAHEWTARFDIVGFLWEELGAWIRGLLAEVHILARSYGWREDDVLALSPWRRRYYIGLVRS